MGKAEGDSSSSTISDGPTNRCSRADSFEPFDFPRETGGSGHPQQRNLEPLTERQDVQTWQPGANQTSRTERLYRRTEEERTCAHCGSVFRPLLVNERQQFCSRDCYRLAPKDRSGAKNPNWKGGIAKDHMRYKLRFQAKNPEKVAAHMAVYAAKRNGTLVPQPCETCGSERSHAHHEDYSKPLDVRWLCQTCHNREHAGPRRTFAQPAKKAPFLWRGRWRS